MNFSRLADSNSEAAALEMSISEYSFRNCPAQCHTQSECWTVKIAMLDYY